ncbi:magnesium/cobalt transporter CorA [Candidatus Methylomicrobium oryzae]|uniref:magnesium/cobalt transporter CorA n=1 Tax=Candidatus Methylomicrobium oryzae TaxID=2802053 RepID=UPI0019237079|nr:magnesium/cobalt transporter CorA [Methylomicrobium sp. RS1]MBL1264459.1 magnesium/cobalt transporter CorA [Methylomicrobium sp. RS1]
MIESLSYASEKSGMPPGSLVHVGEVHDHLQSITVINYNASLLEIRTLASVDEILQYDTPETVTWIIVNGLQNVSIVEAIGRHFNIHHLVLEDILNTHQRPKFEEFENYLYIVFKAIALLNGDASVEYEQISLLLLNNIVFTFKEKPDTILDPIINRLKVPQSHIRTQKGDYLAYVIMDTVIDEYFALQDAYDELIETVEDELLTNPTHRTLGTIQKIKRELVYLRRSVSPLRELLAAIHRSESPLLKQRTKQDFTDVYDHAIRIIETLESYRDLISGMLDIYLSSISNKMNETMKVLTVFATLFIPLTFIAGVYGMNFEYMPELKWKWGYPALWAVFIVIAGVLLIFFKKRKWI